MGIAHKHCSGCGASISPGVIRCVSCWIKEEATKIRVAREQQKINALLAKALADAQRKKAT